MEQFVIMFNDYPEEVCAPGTTEEQADARATEIKEAWYLKTHGANWRSLKQWDRMTVYIRASRVKVWQPPRTTEEQSNG